MSTKQKQNHKAPDNFSYELSVSNTFVNEIGAIKCFGIKLTNNGSTIKSIDDLTTKKSAVEELINTLNREQLDPIHFDEIIEDYLDDLI